MQNFDFNEALKAIQSGKPITVKSAVSSFELETPCDRNGEFEPERGNSEESLSRIARRRLCLSYWLRRGS